MSIIQRVPWTVQPQVAVPLNPKWVARGLLAAFTPAFFTQRSGALPYSALSRSGKGIATATAGTSVAQENTFLIVANLTSVTVDAVAIGRIRYNGSANYGTGIRFNAATFEVDKGNGDANWSYSNVSSAVLTGRHIYAATVASGVAAVMFRDGVKLTTSLSSLATANLTAFDGSMNLGQGNASGATAITAAIGGVIEVGAHFASTLTDNEIAFLSANPYDIFSPLPRRIWAPAAAGGGSTGTVAYTNANDTSAASGTTTVVGTVAKTEAADTSAASGTTTVTGTLATTNANDTCAASGTVGNDVDGTVAYTNANDTSAASGTTTVVGTLAYTNANDTSAASGTTTVTGTVARTNADDSVVASGAAGTVSGTVAYTNANDTVSANGNGGIAVYGSEGYWPSPRRKTKKQIDDERRERLGLPVEVIEAVAAAPKERRKITLADLIGKQKAAGITSVDLTEAVAKHKRRKRQQEDDLLMLM